jgi:hypothetical protein
MSIYTLWFEVCKLYLVAQGIEPNRPQACKLICAYRSHLKTKAFDGLPLAMKGLSDLYRFEMKPEIWRRFGDTTGGGV